MNEGYVICPFYTSHANKRIRCEGAIFNTKLTVIFPSEDERRRHYARYCETFLYEKCPYAKNREDLNDEDIIKEIEKAAAEVLKFKQRHGDDKKR